MRLTDRQLERVFDAGCMVEKATRFETKFWNTFREPDEPRVYGGWYWWHRSGGRAETDLFGPYRTEMAALSAAYDKLVLGRDCKRLADPGLMRRRTAARRAA